MDAKIRILYIDDYALDRELVKDALEKEHGGFELMEASNRKEFETLLKAHAFDLVLSDFNIAGFEGLQVLEAVHAHDPRIPVIIVTGTGSEEIAVKALKQGASDYVIKRPQHIRKLPQTILTVLEKEALVAKRIQAEKALVQSESHLRSLVDTIPDLIWLKDQDGVYLSCNPMFERFFGAKESEIVGKTDYDFVDRDLADFFRANDRKAMAANKPRKNEEALTFAENGYKGLFETIKTPMHNSNGEFIGVLGIARDITELRNAENEKLRLERQLKHIQKMESIGNLAGGIAHEFNNVLGIILGNAELAIDDVPDWNPAKESLKEIRKASFRAKEVVAQILSFARKTITALKPLEVNTVVKESLKLMRASIPTMIDIQQSIPAKPSTIFGDPTEIHQIVINLCNNASHAMKETGGILKVEISEVSLNEDSAFRYEALSPGDFVRLTVKDSGEGITPDVLENVFEPYFTTKEFGEGNGMGLSVVYGLVKKCKGAIKIDSIVGKGTTVEVLFPKIEEETPAEEKIEGELPKGNERILLVDDDPSIVSMICQMLERFGYTVTSMTDSTTALERFKSAPDDFDLVITDMSMPKMSGDQLAAELMKIRKDVPILLCTGHSDAVDEKKARQIGIKGFAMKPLDMSKLASAVREALDGL